MAKNREPVKQPESDTSDESDSEESDSDSEPAPILVKKPSTSALDKSPPPPPEEEEEDDTDSNSEVPDLKTMPSKSPQKPEEEEEEDDSDSDSDSKVPDLPNVKPMASKSIETPQKPVKISQSKPLASVPAATSKSTSKRPAEEKELDEGKDSKKSKKKPVPESQNEPLGAAASDSSKRVLFQRIWSEEDEIVVVKGMINYFAKKKSKPTADLGAFLEYIKKDLHIEVKKEQLKAKIQKLKKRYETNKIKGRNFTKPHEKELFDLSETYWGTEKGKDIAAKANGSVVKKMPIKKANIVENEEDDDDDDTMMSEEIGNDDSKGKGLAPTRCSNGLTVDERVMRIGAELFEGANGVVEGYKEWKNLTIKEFELHVRRLDLMRTRSQLVLDYLKSKNH